MVGENRTVHWDDEGGSLKKIRNIKNNLKKLRKGL
jgi:hypothetical protein